LEEEMADPTTLSYQQVVRTGLETTYAAVDATNGNRFINDGRMFLHVKNGHTSPITVTIATPGTVDGLAVADQAVVVTNAEERMIGPFPPGIYNDGSGYVQITYSLGTAMTIALLRL
jgi:hypothetical protein